MIEAATGQEINTLLDDRLASRFGLSDDTAHPDIGNTRYAGAIASTAADYGRLLEAVLDGRLVSDRDGFLEDRTPDIPIVFRPGTVELNMFDWHYGFGFWKECDLSSYQPECNIDPTISSPGGFGFTPWIDFDAGYWGVIAIEERPGFGSNPSQQSRARTGAPAAHRRGYSRIMARPRGSGHLVITQAVISHVMLSIGPGANIVFC